MAQADGVVANGTGSAVRSDINTQYAALWSNHSGSTEPSTGKVAYQFWADTNTSILKIRNSANNAWINLFTLAGGIDVDAASNFNEDVTFTGVTAGRNAFWDKSQNSLELGDYTYLKFGSDEDLTVWSNDTLSAINNKTGELRILSGNNVRILKRSDAGIGFAGQVANFNIDGAVELYYDASKKFETTSTGVQVTGNIDIDGNIDGADGSKIKLGTGDDLQIYHDGTHSYVDNTRVGGFTIFRTSASSANDLEPFSISNGGRMYNNCVSGSTANLTLKKGASGANGIDFFQCRSDGNSLRLHIEGDGDVANNNNSYTGTSDVKLKENIVDASSQWDDIKAIKVRNFNFKESTGFGTDKHIGVIAQEIETVSAGLVKESIDRDPDTNADLGTKTKSVKYSILYMKAVKCLQEAMTKIETLETKVAALEAK